MAEARPVDANDDGNGPSELFHGRSPPPGAMSIKNKKKIHPEV